MLVNHMNFRHLISYLIRNATLMSYLGLLNKELPGRTKFIRALHVYIMSITYVEL